MTAEQSLLSQTHLRRVLLPQQMERAGPHRHPICRGIVLPDATAVFIACDIQRPMQLIFNVPMVANHLDKRICRLPQTGKRKPVVCDTDRRRGLTIQDTVTYPIS